MSDKLDLDELRATYDHPADKSVIEVINRLEQAEQAVARKQDALDTVAESFQNALDKVVAATRSEGLINDDGDGDWCAVWERLADLADHYRDAEQQVSRVRELKEGKLCSNCLAEVESALGGEQDG